MVPEAALHPCRMGKHCGSQHNGHLVDCISRRPRSCGPLYLKSAAMGRMMCCTMHSNELDFLEIAKGLSMGQRGKMLKHVVVGRQPEFGGALHLADWPDHAGAHHSRSGSIGGSSSSMPGLNRSCGHQIFQGHPVRDP